MTIQEQIVMLVPIAHAIIDSLSAQDVGSGQVSSPLVIALESIASQDTVSVTREDASAFVINVHDDVMVVETSASSIPIAIVSNESLTVDDEHSQIVPLEPGEEGYVYINEEIKLTLVSHIQAEGQVASSEAVQSRINILTIADENITVSEDISFGQVINTQNTDFINVQENNAGRILLNAEVLDSIDTSEQVAISIDQQVSVGDSITYSSDISIGISIDLSTSDQISVIENVLGSSALIIATSDALAASDITEITSALCITQAELITISDQVTLIPPVDLISSEHISLNDIATVIMPLALGIAIQDEITLGELVNPCLVNTLSIDDLIAVSDSVPSLSRIFTINIPENISVQDIVNDIYVTYPSYQPPIAGSAAQVRLSTSGDGNVNLETTGSGAVEKITGTGSTRNKIGGGSGRVLGG